MPLPLTKSCHLSITLTQNVSSGEGTSAGHGLEELDDDVHLVGDGEGLQRADGAHQRAAQDQRLLAAPSGTGRQTYVSDFELSVRYLP